MSLGSGTRVELHARATQQPIGLLVVEAQVATPTSASHPRVRQRASGRAGSSRLATAICAPDGTYSHRVVSASRQDGLLTA
jgi:hypothetical protein